MQEVRVNNIATKLNFPQSFQAAKNIKSLYVLFVKINDFLLFFLSGIEIIGGKYLKFSVIF